MSLLVRVSGFLYTVCSYIAGVVTTVKDAVQYLAMTNYNVVATVISFLGYVVESVRMIVEQLVFCVREVVEYLGYFVNTVNLVVDSLFAASWKMMHGIHSCVVGVYDSITTSFSATVCAVTDTLLHVKNWSVEAYGSIASVVSGSVAICVSSAMAVVMFVTSVGHFCVHVVTSVWRGLGFVLASVAYCPVYFFEWVESVKNKLVENILHVVTSFPKETYLGIICLCLLYFTLSNAVRYVSCHGLKIFSLRMRSRRHRPNFEWQFDQDFESDFEDLYGNDGETNVWMIPRLTGSGRTQENNDADDERDETNTSDSGTVDDGNEVSDSDEGDDDDDDDEEEEDRGSEDGITVISDDSDTDSDTSLNSHTLSTESSEHEIEISLPTVDERYSLRSRSSTPCSTGPKMLSSPEDFTREMEREKDKRKCVVCQDQIKSVLVLPCRHMCLCVLCADQLVRSRAVSRRVCPLCRARIEKVMNVYV